MAPWRSAQVRRLWLVRVGTELAEQLTTIALLWFVVELTGSGAAAGLVVLCCKLPAVATGPLAGRLLDRGRPRLVMAAGSAAQALAVAAVPALHWCGGLTLGALCGLAVAAGAAAPVTEVGAQALLPRLVDERDLEPANALLSVADQLGFLVGPAAAGFLVAAAGGPPVLLGAAGGLLLGPFDAATVIGLSALACLLAGAAALLSPSLRAAGAPAERSPRAAGVQAARNEARTVDVTRSPAAGT